MAELGLVGKIAASIVSDILKQLCSYPVKKMIGIWKVEKGFQKLAMTLEMLLAALRDAEKRQNNPELVGCWLERLKDVAYEADDVLGEFSFEARRMGFDMRIDHSKMEKVRGFFSNIHAVKFRYNMADKIEKINEKLDDIGKDMESFKYVLGGVNIDHSDQNDRAGLRKTYSFDEDLHFVGREKEKSMLINMLIGCSSSDEETLSVVSILGIGGLGKTALARRVYHDGSVVEHFKKKLMWVSVSRDFEIRKLREGMVESLTGVKPQSSETDEVIQKKLDENIGGNKFLLVLDNVWNADIGEWEKLRDSLKIGIQGSKIIVTTRDTRVASIIRTLQQPFNLEGLSEHDSWSLFETRAFAIGGATKNPNTETIGRALVEKCKGVPLAIKSLGALMHSKTTDLDWESIQFSEIWKLEGQDNISSVLKLSYHDMPTPVKRCFTYCSIFPKGHKIVKNTLIQLWMAEGLLQSSSSDDKLMEDDVGLEYFKSLVWSSFLQDVEKDKFGEEVACKMHDLVHDLAQNIIGNECMIVEDFDNKDKPKVEETRYLSVVGHYKKLTPEEFKLEKVRDYLYLGGSDDHADPIHISAKMFSTFKSLRVLVLSYAGIGSLSSSIGELKQLRYLDLSGNRFVTFPKCITKLYNLQTLKMLHMQSPQGILPKGIFETLKMLRMQSPQGILPKGITKMINLRHLEVDDGIKLPKGIGQLTNLRTLNCFPLDKDTADTAGIGELGNLRQLGGTLKLDICSWSIIDSDTAASFEELRLKQLELVWRFDLRDPEHGFDSVSNLLESLKPHKNLIRLRVVGFKGTKAPTWLDGSGTSHLWLLQDLEFVDCPNIKSLSLVGLCSLRWLKISDCPKLSLKLGNGLTALEDIACSNLESVGVPPEEDGMPDLISLKKLKICECTSLATLPDEFFSLLTSLETLDMGERYFIGRLRALDIERRRGLEALPEGLGNLSSLQQLTLFDIPNQTELPKSFGNLSSLQKLYIQRCEGLAALSEKFGDLLKLQDLTIIECGSLEAFPESFGNLSKLRGLTIKECGSLAALPERFGDLLNLQQLSIEECGRLAVLPKSFGNLLKLSELSIWKCGSLAALPESFGNVLKLQWLSIRECGSLAALPESFGNLLELERLSIFLCGRLGALPENFGNLSKLQNLIIEKCGSLVALPESFGNLLNLQRLIIEECGSLAALPESFGDLLNLQRLHIEECESLAALPDGFGNLLELQELDMISCESLATLSESFGNLLKLRRLNIRGCQSLLALPKSLGSSLESLDVVVCNALTALSENLGDLSSLKSLTIIRCRNLASLAERICGLTSLAYLSISGCKSMRSFPDGIQDLRSLRKLHICGLENLEALPDGLRNLSSLIILSIEDCPRLESLTDWFEGLTSLKRLSLLRLVNLTALPKGLGKLSSLEKLYLDGCKDLKFLPKEIRNLTSLRRLSMIDCPQLKRRYRQHRFRGWPRIISHIPVIEMERVIHGSTDDASESESEFE